MVLSLLRGRRSRGASDGGARFALPVPPGAGTLTCEVVDPMGQPLGGAEITVTSQESARTAAKGTTDLFGMFVAALPPGEYRLLMTAEGMQPASWTFDIAVGETLSMGRVQLDVAQQLQPPAPGTWLFDPPHTAIRFIAKHVGMANVHGRFTTFEGGVRIAPSVEDSQVEIRIDASSITTGNKTRDNHLRSADFLDVENYPYLHFTSSRFVYRGGNNWSVQGGLTMHGVNRSVSLDTQYLGTVNGGYGEELRCAARATAELHREDYTLNWRNMLARGIAIVGPTIQLEMDIQTMFQGPDTPTPPE
ncbi:YceI family protein [Streptomyces atroolivaceus]|uniref:YceI family protein n=1 Tax=Streptomyces atroolivaceus TaxID=66869 RepID=UPI00202549FD|nr:YceI family protein [Streptomyces atroolivaceus]